MVKSRPKIVDVAKAAGVSPATVSNALTENRHVDPLTRERVKAAAKRLGYTPDLRAQRLRTGRANTIAILSSMPFAVSAGPSRLGFLMEIAAIAAGTALENGLALVLVPPSEARRLPIEHLDINGAIVVEPLENDAEVSQLRQRGIPVVTIGRQFNDKDDIPYVDLRSAETTRLMLTHLAERSARHIALVIGKQKRNSYQEAEREYEAFAAARGMAPRIVRVDESLGEAGGGAACARLLTKHPQIDALCVPVDAFASGAIRTAADLGLRIPRDLMLVTRHDGHRARESTPKLTAINLHLDRIAAAAVELLLERLGGNSSRRFIQAPPPELIIRESSDR